MATARAGDPPREDAPPGAASAADRFAVAPLAPMSTEGLTPKGRQTRERILAGARKAFEASASYTDTRIADIVEAAGVAYGSFYRYFESKEQLFYELAVAVVDESFTAGRSDYRGNDPVARLDATNRRYYAVYREYHVIMTVIEQAAALHEEFRGLRRHLRERFVHAIANNIRNLASAGIVDDQLDPLIAAHALVSMTDNFAYVWIVLGEPFDEEAALTNITRLWVNALKLQPVRQPAAAAPD